MKKIIERVKLIVLKPRETWETISAEEATVSELFKKYLLILAAVPTLASFLGRWIIGYHSRYMEDVHLTFGQSLLSSIFLYVLIVGGIWLTGKIISLLALKFGSEQDDVKGFKVSIYSYTPLMVAGVLFLIPNLEILVPLGGLYGLYLLYIGLPIIMDIPKEKSLAYIIVVSIIGILIVIIVGSIYGAVLGAFGPSLSRI